MRNFLIVMAFCAVGCVPRERIKDGDNPIVDTSAIVGISPATARPAKELDVTAVNDTSDIPVGKINGVDLAYDCLGCRDGESAGINIYAGKERKNIISNSELGGFYIDKVYTLTEKNEKFIYVGTTHTYGHSQGYLYHLDTVRMRAYQVKTARLGYKLPDSLQSRKYFELTREDGSFGGGGTFYCKNSRREGSYQYSYVLLKDSRGTYFLKPVNYVLDFDE